MTDRSATRRTLFALSLLVAATGGSCALGACDDKDKKPPQPQVVEPPPPGSVTQNSNGTASGVGTAAATPFDPTQLAVFAKLPASIERPDNALSDDKVQLGRALYFDARLSKGQDVSCNSCHDLAKGGADGNAVSIGTKKQKGTRNTPTIFNAAGGYAQGWDGRYTLVEEMIVPHVADPSVMATDDKRLVAVVTSIPGYAPLFKKAFPDPEDKGAITKDTIGKAIAAFTRKLLTPSRWDQMLAGKNDALTDPEKVGLGVFMESACITCHAGKYVGAAQAQKLGVAKPWPAADGGAGAADGGVDVGRFAVTKEEVDRGVFKVPTLRNVTATGPWLHDGSIASLEEITRLMARHQVGKTLSDAQVQAIVTFLGALTGEPPKDLVSKPELPANGPKTPKPE